jgi:hypothetical protein
VRVAEPLDPGGRFSDRDVELGERVGAGAQQLGPIAVEPGCREPARRVQHPGVVDQSVRRPGQLCDHLDGRIDQLERVLAARVRVKPHADPHVLAVKLVSEPGAAD